MRTRRLRRQARKTRILLRNQSGHLRGFIAKERTLCAEIIFYVTTPKRGSPLNSSYRDSPWITRRLRTRTTRLEASVRAGHFSYRFCWRASCLARTIGNYVGRTTRTVIASLGRIPLSISFFWYCCAIGHGRRPLYVKHFGLKIKD